MRIYVFIIIWLGIINNAYSMKRDLCHPTLIDCTIVVKTDDGELSVPCSRFNLALHSGYFFENMGFRIDVDESMTKGKLPIFFFAISIMHNNKINDAPIFSAEEVQNYFDLIKIKLKCDKKYYHKFFYPLQSINYDETQKIKLFELPKNRPLILDEEYKNFILLPLKNDIITRFYDAHTLLQSLNEFKNLSPIALKIIFESDSFKTDSEDSIFLLIRLWVSENEEKLGKNELVEKYLKPLLLSVRFNYVNPDYLVNFIGEFMNKYDLKDWHYQIMKDYISTKKISKEQSRLYCNNDNKIAVKVEFKKISEWKNGEKYYGQPLVFRGYKFYFFIRIEDKIEGYQFLGGYIRCISGADNLELCLPVKITFGLDQQNGHISRLPPITDVFKYCDRSIGTRIGRENWDQIKRGQSDIVIDDSITVHIVLELI